MSVPVHLISRKRCEPLSVDLRFTVCGADIKMFSHKPVSPFGKLLFPEVTAIKWYVWEADVEVIQ